MAPIITAPRYVKEASEKVRNPQKNNKQIPTRKKTSQENFIEFIEC